MFSDLGRLGNSPCEIFYKACQTNIYHWFYYIKCQKYQKSSHRTLLIRKYINIKIFLYVLVVVICFTSRRMGIHHFHIFLQWEEFIGNVQWKCVGFMLISCFQWKLPTQLIFCKICSSPWVCLKIKWSYSHSHWKFLEELVPMYKVWW